MPTVFSASSTPVNLDRCHSPPRARRGCGDVPGRREQEPDRVLGGAHDVRLRRVDHHHARLGGGLHVDVVQPDAGPGHHPSRRAAAIASASTWVALRTSSASASASAAAGGPVGAVAVPDLEVGPEGVDRRRRELLGDEHDRPGHRHSP